jgi:hypothetical protein
MNYASDYDERCNCCAGVIGNAYCLIHASRPESIEREPSEEKEYYSDFYPRTKILSCNRCGSEDVKWVQQIDKKWILCDLNGTSHVCSTS